MVVKLALVPGHRTRSAKADALVFVWTSRVALLVMLVHSPVISMVYEPESAGTTLLIVRELFVWPLRIVPSFRQTKLKGPGPSTSVLKLAFCPGHRTKLVRALA